MPYQWPGVTIPPGPPKVPVEGAPPLLGVRDRQLMRAMAFRATRVLPGPIGELVSRELFAVEEMAYLGDKSGLSWRLVEYVRALPDPGTDQRE